MSMFNGHDLCPSEICDDYWIPPSVIRWVSKFLIIDVIKETEKAFLIKVEGDKCLARWIPKRCIINDNNDSAYERYQKTGLVIF